MIFDVIQDAGGAQQMIEAGSPVPDGWVVVSQTSDPDWLTPPVKARVLTKYAFRKLFTLPERIAVDGGPDNAALPADGRAALRTMALDMAAADEIDLDDPDVIAGVQMLETLGLIASGRAALILG